MSPGGSLRNRLDSILSQIVPTTRLREPLARHWHGQSHYCWGILKSGVSEEVGTSVEGAKIVATIVLADDDDDLRDIYASALRNAGHTVSEAIDGPSAIDAVRKLRPNLILLDIWMPGLNGFEVLDALRHDPAGTRLVIVVLSNLADAEARLEAFASGASAYLVKGRPLTELLGRVEQALLDPSVPQIHST